MVVEQLEKIFMDILKEKNIEVDSIRVILSNRPDLCDYQCDEAFKLAKVLHRSPLEIGQELVSALEERSDFSSYFSKVECVAPGFINMTLSDSFLFQMLEKMKEDEHFHLPQIGKGKTIFLDYGGPNVAKPLHVGHMRTAIVGESIKRILAYAGYHTIADVHLGDYGLQIGEVIYGLKEEGIEISKITIQDLDRIYPKMSALCKENEDIKEECATITKELQDGKEEYREYWKKICEVSSQDILGIYQFLDVSFDLWLGESDAYPYILELTKILEEKHLLKDSEGARIIEVAKPEDKKEIPPLLYQKGNGAYLYATTDLATILDRVHRYHPEKILYVTDSRQALHFEQVFRASSLAGIAPYSTFEHLGYGTVNGTDGKPYKTRNGDSPKLQYLFDQAREVLISKKDSNEKLKEEDIDCIVNAILKFADLSNNRERDYIFDIAKFSEVVGKTGPYILYTYLRISKILKQEEGKEHKLGSEIYNSCDRDLRLKLLELPIAFENALQYRMPSYIADFVYEVATLANVFYQTNHIQGLEDEKKKENWLALLELTNRVLKEMLSLLVIKIPTEM